ncbi:hypothetical protein Javan340_0024 [Streptococcus phage Javan340]|nr:hypothetical protein Javan340_0024 [Streptococcus phage Javan340]
MIPKYRAWYVLAEEMINEILMISFVRKEIIGKFSNGSTSVPLKFEDERNGEDVILMQSTGLKDKNGKEIFEGDIVKMSKDVYSEPTYYEVVRHRSGAYRLESKQHGCELWLRHTNCEVVGNVYETKELLDA